MGILFPCSFGFRQKSFSSIPADFATFTEEILNGRLHFLCSAEGRNFFEDSVLSIIHKNFSEPQLSDLNPRPNLDNSYNPSGLGTTEGRGHVSPTFLRSKNKKPTKVKRESVSKQKQLKGCYQGQNVTVLAILECLGFKIFSCWSTIVADNTFQCSMAPPL